MTRHARVVLAPGLTLIDAVSRAMAELAWPSATLQMLGGPLARAVFTCSKLTPGGPRWIDYGPQRDLGSCWLALGNATFGTDMDGGPALHAHGILCDDAARPVGGHLVPDLCRIGAQGIVAHAASTPGAGFRVIADGSGFNLLAPSLAA